MRELSFETIAKKISELCIEANLVLPGDVCSLIDSACDNESSPLGKSIMFDLKRNYEMAREKRIPICQDTGMAVVFAEIGQELHINGGDFNEAIHEGVRRGYERGFLRKSVVSDPLRRENTGDNTPAVIHTKIVPGDSLRLRLAPKGFGSENMSRMKMLLPSSEPSAVVDFIVETVKSAGANPCPPVIVGVGLGGTVELAALLAKEALLRNMSEENADPFYAGLEAAALKRINELGIGPQGFGGKTTALAVNIKAYPTHIAGMPCVVNMSCHVTRHAEAVL